jgi:membrane-bound metal-dependent hydrolase YbcI (DUF457 family)
MMAALMPTPIGHALAGVGVAWIAEFVPGLRDDIAEIGSGKITVVCAVVAALPDVDLLVPPVAHRTITHSLGAALLVTIIAAGVTGRVTRGMRRRGQAVAPLVPRSREGTVSRVWPLAMLVGAAYGSHIVLDWLAIDRFPPYGVQALWPFSTGWYLSGLDLFGATERRHLFSIATWVINGKAVARETAVIGPVLAALWLIREKAAARLPSQLARRHHPSQ